MMVRHARRSGCGSARARSGGVWPSPTSPPPSSGAPRPGSAASARRPRTLAAFLDALHPTDLALAAACALGPETRRGSTSSASIRPVLLRVARKGQPADRARDVADSIYARTVRAGASATGRGGRCSTTTTAAVRWPVGCEPSSRSGSSIGCARRAGSNRCRMTRRGACRRRAGRAGPRPRALSRARAARAGRRDRRASTRERRAPALALLRAGHDAEGHRRRARRVGGHRVAQARADAARRCGKPSSGACATAAADRGRNRAAASTTRAPTRRSTWRAPCPRRNGAGHDPDGGFPGPRRPGNCKNCRR